MQEGRKKRLGRRDGWRLGDAPREIRKAREVGGWESFEAKRGGAEVAERGGEGVE
jgi:hypothetical protein